MSQATEKLAATLTRKTLYLSHFTPSMMPPETLEAMLVQREPVLSRCLDNVLDSLRTGSSHHTLDSRRGHELGTCQGAGSG